MITGPWKRVESRTPTARMKAILDEERDLHALEPCLLAILSEAEIALEHFGEQTPSVVRHAVRRIAHQAARTRRLVHDLLDLADFDAGRLKLQRHRVDVARFVAGAIERGIPAIDRDRIRIEVFDVVASVVDVPRLERALATLLDHALGNTALGSHVRVRIDRRPFHATITVIDQGIGLTADQAQALFERAPARRGVPFYVTRKLVEAHGGTVAVETSAGRGTRFVIELPIAGR